MTGLIDLNILRRLYEFGLMGLFVIVTIRCLQIRGATVTLRELVFGFTLTQAVEFMAVGLGRYDYPDWIIYFPPKPEWVPLGIGLAWAAGAPCIMRVSEGILGEKAALWKLAIVDGLMAVGVDLILDPAVSGEPLRMWLWSGPRMYSYRHWLLNVPVFNFFGWVMLIGSCGYQLRYISRLEAKSEKERWMKLGIFLVANLIVAFGIMQLPW